MNIGYLTINMAPSQAVSSGSAWKVDHYDTSWHTGTVSTATLATGSYTITYKYIAGWTSPGSESVNILSGSTVYRTGTYTK